LPNDCRTYTTTTLTGKEREYAITLLSVVVEGALQQIVWKEPTSPATDRGGFAVDEAGEDLVRRGGGF
jgi:hypothetical protein